MEILQKSFEYLQSFFPSGIAAIVVIIVLLLIHYILNKRYTYSSGRRFRLQIIMTALSFGGLLMIIMILPISDTTRGQILSLIGILLSAAIALSSTTVLGNAMAGFMLRIIRNFKSGDFIRVGEHFGRVSERGLFHIEIQTEDRDLTTLPNLYLVTNPVKVVRSSGTFISATVSLGYDIPRTKIERLLIKAAKAAELNDPFVQVLKLGDYAVTYRVAGLLTEVKQVISTRSHLYIMMLDALHQEGVEIVSPSFMNTRNVTESRQFIPGSEMIASKTEKAESEEASESLVFDKAEQAEALDKMQDDYKSAGKELEEIKKQLEQTKIESEKDKIQANIYRLEARRELLMEILKQRKEKGDE